MRARNAAGAALIGLALAGFPAGARAAEDVASFYQGKTIHLMVGYSPGGLYDITARLLSRHMSGHLPGKPTIVVENAPGAGSLTLILHLLNIAPRDGTVIGMVTRSFPIDPIFNPASRKYDPLALEPIGSTTSEVSITTTWYTSPVKTFTDLFTHSATFGAVSFFDDTGFQALLVKNLTHAKIDIVTGYPGGNDITNAMEKGEVDGRFGWSWGAIKARARPWLDGHKINLVLQLSLKKAPDLPDTPFIMDYARSDADKQALELIFAPQIFAWPFVAPPGLPPDRLQALRAAFDATMKDKAFRADAARLNIEINPVGGTEMTALIHRILGFDKNIVDHATTLVQQK